MWNEIILAKELLFLKSLYTCQWLWYLKFKRKHLFDIFNSCWREQHLILQHTWNIYCFKWKCFIHTLLLSSGKIHDYFSWSYTEKAFMRGREWCFEVTHELYKHAKQMDICTLGDALTGNILCTCIRLRKWGSYKWLTMLCKHPNLLTHKRPRGKKMLFLLPFHRHDNWGIEG